MKYFLHIIMVLILCMMVACGDKRAEPEVNPDGQEESLKDGEKRAQELVNYFKQAGNVVSSVYIVYQPPEKEHLSFSITSWSHNDGRIRLRMTKLGVDFLEGLITKDGHFTGVLVRDKKVVKGNVEQLLPKLEEKAGKKLEDVVEKVEGEKKGAPLLAAIELLRNEIKHGPINIRQDGYKIGKQMGKESLYFNLPHGFSAAVVLGSRKRQPVVEKVVFNKEKKEVFRLAYDKPKKYDEMHRMSKMQLRIPNDKGKYTIILKKLDAVRHIQEKNLHLEVPDYPEISIEEFGKKVTEKDG